MLVSTEKKEKSEGIKIISNLIKKYKKEGDSKKVKELQSIGLDLACEDFVETTMSEVTYWSANCGEFKTYNRK